jgi:hypothetical protein
MWDCLGMTWTRSKHVEVFVECMWKCTFQYLCICCCYLLKCSLLHRHEYWRAIVTRFVQCLTGTINTSHRTLQGRSITVFRTKITSEVITLLNATRWFHWRISTFQRSSGKIIHFAQAGKRLKIRPWSDSVSYILKDAPTIISTFPFLCNRRPPPAASAAQQITVLQGKVRNVWSMRDFTLPPRSE